MTAYFDANWCEAALKKKGISLGLPLTVLPVTSSTNDLALEALRRGELHGACFVAETQTRGRGRRGRRWESQAGDSLTFSLVVRPSWPMKENLGFPLVIGLAVRHALSAWTELPPRVKWPNDVWVDRRKVAGILVEAQSTRDEVTGLAVGIGINVRRGSIGKALGAQATCLEAVSRRMPMREAVLLTVLGELHAAFARYGKDGLSGFLDELARWDALRGCRIRVDDVVGVASGFNSAGALLVRTVGRALVPVLSGTVEIVD